MTHYRAPIAVVFVMVCALGCSTSSADESPPIIPAWDSYPHAGIYDMVTLGGDTLPVTDTIETGQLVTERTWMRLTSFATVEWFQYGELKFGTDTYQVRTEHDGEWVGGSRPNSGSIIWAWRRVYIDDQLAESANMPDSDEYVLTSEGLQFLTTQSVYRRR